MTWWLRLGGGTTLSSFLGGIDHTAEDCAEHGIHNGQMGRVCEEGAPAQLGEGDGVNHGDGGGESRGVVGADREACFLQ